MKRAGLIIWGYTVELIAAALVYAVLWMLFAGNRLASFLSDSWIAWLTLCGLIFTAAGGLFVALFHTTGSDFGGYLAHREADGRYKLAFGVAIAISFMAIVSFILSGYTKVPWTAHVSGFLLLLSCINLYSMFKNASDLMKLHTLFEQTKREHEQKEKDSGDTPQ